MLACSCLCCPGLILINITYCSTTLLVFKPFRNDSSDSARFISQQKVANKKGVHASHQMFCASILLSKFSNLAVKQLHTTVAMHDERTDRCLGKIHERKLLIWCRRTTQFMTQRSIHDFWKNFYRVVSAR